MILTFGSSRRAASQSVVTSGSSADVVMNVNSSSSFRDAPLGAGPESILPVVVMDSGLARFARALRCAIAHRGMTRELVSLQATRKLTLRLFRLEFLDRAAGVAPGAESAAHMGDRL